MIEALIGLSGVVIGVLATGLKDWIVFKMTSRQRKQYLATRVVSMLEIFVDNCAQVVKDDGTYRGLPDKDGYYLPQVATPKFDPLSLEVDWLSINSELMHQILYLPNEIYVANSKIESVWDYVAEPPDYAELFEERHYQYSLLAIKATKLIQSLYNEAKLKECKGKWEWFKPELFESVVKKVELGRGQKFT